MNLIGRESERGLKLLERALGGPTFTWNGKDYPCTPGKLDELFLLSAGGLTPANTLVLNVRKSVLPEPGPQPKHFLSFNGYKWRVEHVNEAPDGAWVKFVCVDPSRGA